MPALPSVFFCGLFFCGVISFGLVGCQRATQRPELLYCVFLDDKIANHRLDRGEHLILGFSTRVELKQPVRAGVRFLPTVDAPAYTLMPPDPAVIPTLPLDRRNLVIELRDDWQRAPAQLVDRFGEADTPDAIGVELDFDEIAVLVDTAGRALVGRSRSVDLAPTPLPPIEIEGASWVDEDHGFTVNEGDLLVLNFSAEVSPAAPLKSARLVVPADLLILPVAGDRLDDGKRPARILESGTAQRSLRIVLGSSPQLTPGGEFALDAVERGAPSGIALRGTEIRPQMQIVAAHDSMTGAIGRGTIDIEGDCEPFTATTIDFDPANAVLEGVVATELPDGSVLFTGGRATAAGQGASFLSNAYLFGPEPGRWRGPFPLAARREGHSATYLRGADGNAETADDFVVISGGTDNSRGEPVDSVELFFPFVPGEPQVRIAEDRSGFWKARAYHTAHALLESNRLLVCGGYGRDGRLNDQIQLLEFHTESGESTSARAGFDAINKHLLTHPRAHHQSILLERNGLTLLFVYGGFGEFGQQLGVSRAWSRTLDAPEVIHFSENLYTAANVDLPADKPPPGERIGHRLILLDEESFPVLLVGGSHTNKFNPEFLAHDNNCAEAWRLEIDPRLDPPIQYRSAGRLLANRRDFAAVLLPDRKVLIAGGMEFSSQAPGGGDDAQVSVRVEIFSPDLEEPQFEYFCRDLLCPRSQFAAARFGENQWIFLGGTGATPAVAAEIYTWQERP
ncbi:MAG: hypothetical protein ACKVX7_11540 [Planctomycetota bacterium]